MKTFSALAAVAIIGLTAGSAFAQVPANNPTIEGTMTAPGNSSGAPSAGTPAGQLSTTGQGAPVVPPTPSSTTAAPTVGLLPPSSANPTTTK